MALHYKDGQIQLHHGDCREVLASLPDCSVDSVVTDPPYGLSKEPDAAEVLRHWLAGDDYTHTGGGFMGKSWDSFVPGPTVWREVFRVLKPGGHVCVFGGSRTYDLMVMSLRLAGFEIRDCITWNFGSGFPKSLNVSKAIDKQRDDKADIYRVTAWVREVRDAAGITNKDIDAAFGFAGMAGHWTSGKSQPAVPTLEQVPLLLDTLGVEFDDVPEEIRRLLWDLNGRKGQPGENWWKREVVGPTVRGAQQESTGRYGAWGEGITPTTAATDAAKQWEGWGTALKPAHEPIVLARKPLIGTVAQNVLTHGTGALNIDGARVASADDTARRPAIVNDTAAPFGRGVAMGGNGHARGRWPANVIFDTEAGALLDEQSGVSRSQTSMRGERTGNIYGNGKGPTGPDTERGHSDTGGASRFFTAIDWHPEIDVPFRYIAKPSKRERNAGLDGLPERSLGVGDERPSGSFNERLDKPAVQPRANHHPTVKPLALMRWLVRLVTPPGGTVLEPFAGSGTTLMACVMEGFNGIGIELTDEYLPIIEGRVKWAHDNQPTQEQLPL
jgi:DNA modification methylase